MPRRAREESPTGIYHVTSRGNGGLTLFVDDGDRRTFLAVLDRVAAAEAWRVYAFCLMDTHFHLVLRAGPAELSRGMQRLKGRYGQYSNERRGGWGHIFEARFPSKPIVTEGHAVLACAYVAVNPVEAGLCATAANWPWSSHSAILGQSNGWPFLAPIEELGTTATTYARLVTDREHTIHARRQGGTDPSGICPRAPSLGTDPRSGTVRVRTPPLALART